MKIAFRFLLFLVPVMAVAVFGSIRFMDHLEQKWLLGDLSRRANLILQGTHDYLAQNLKSNQKQMVARLLERITQDERLTGAMVCTSDQKLVAQSSQIPKTISCATADDSNSSRLLEVDQQPLHEARLEIKDESGLLGWLVLVHDTSYMRDRHMTTRSYFYWMLAGLSLFFFFLTLVIYRWSLNVSLRNLKQAFQGVLSGNTQGLLTSLRSTELSPLFRDLSKVLRELRNAKDTLRESEAAVLWTPSRLRIEVQKYFGNSQLCVIANREPYIHNRKGNQVEVQTPASGLVTAVEPIVRACSGLWIAHGSGSADRETADRSGKLLVPPGNPEYALKRVWLSRAEEQGYYYGFSNEGLWPLCHIAHARPHFEAEDWQHYKRVNEKFASAFVEENPGENPIVLIQDYHFALLPKLIRERKPHATLSLFWHIPWPNPEAFGICPWKKELLGGMLAADLIGFHTQFHCNNFLDTVDRFLEARVDREQFAVTYRGHTCYIKPFPISVEWPSRHAIPEEQFAAERKSLLEELNLPANARIGVGVDRVDYTKGIVERFRSVERLLDKHPEWVGRFSFIQIGAPSRTHIKRYQDLNSEVQELADQINWKFHHAEVPPIILKLAHHNASELNRYYRAADLCFVSSLHDGMNLVAKEYVSARSDLKGALILSNFAGASRELSDALLVNPYSIDECAEALHQGLSMRASEQRQRMERMRLMVSEKNVYAWAGSFLTEIHRISVLKGSKPGSPFSQPHWYSGARG